MDRTQREYVSPGAAEGDQERTGRTRRHSAEVKEAQGENKKAKMRLKPRRPAEKELDRLAKILGSRNIPWPDVPDWLSELPWSESTDDQSRYYRGSKDTR